MEPGHTIIIHMGDIIRFFLPKLKFNFPLTGVDGSVPSTSVHSPRADWMSKLQKRSENERLSEVANESTSRFVYIKKKNL